MPWSWYLLLFVRIERRVSGPQSFAAGSSGIAPPALNVGRCGMFRIARDSPLRKAPQPISEQQIVLLDGIRYSADMAGIAIDRLWDQLCLIDSTEQDIEPHHIAAAALDAWSIIDAAHRMSDLIENLPGLPNSPWRRVFLRRVEDALALRDMWQHPVGEAPAVVRQRGQAWGALAWAQHKDYRPTGRWYLAVAGSDLKGSQWLHAGPVNAIPRVDSRRMRLLHSGRSVYLDRLVRDMFEAVHHLEQDLAAGRLRLVGEQANQPRSNDWVMFNGIEVAVALPPPPPEP
jgi:hypothetical protein